MGVIAIFKMDYTRCRMYDQVPYISLFMPEILFGSYRLNFVRLNDLMFDIPDPASFDDEIITGIQSVVLVFKIQQRNDDKYIRYRQYKIRFDQWQNGEPQEKYSQQWQYDAE